MKCREILAANGRASVSSRERFSGRHLPRLTFMLAAFALALAAATVDFETSYRAGLDALNKNNPAAAQPQLEAAARLQPRNPEVWLALAQVYFKLNKAQLASSAAVKAELLAPSNPLVLHGLAFYYTEARDPAKAAAFEGRYADKAPQDQEAFARAVDLYLRAGKAKPAIPLALRGLARQDSPELHELLAKAYDLDGQFVKAVPEFRRASQMRPYDEGFTFEEAQAYLHRQKFAEALKILQPARERFDKSAQIELATGVALYGLRRFPETIDSFLRTIQLAPDVEQPYVFLGRMIDQAEGKMPEVTAALATYVSVKPDYYLSNFLYAKALITQNADSIQVEPLLKKSIALNNTFWESHFELGSMLEKDHDFAGAAAELEKSIALNPKEPVPHYRLARVYDRLGKPDLAEQQRALHARLSAQPKPGMVK